MAEQNVTKRELEQQNEELIAQKEVLEATHRELSDRLEHMEQLVNQQRADGNYAGPQPVVYHDPFDAGANPHHIKKHPEGKVLSWKNPNIRNGSRGWRGWEPITYDSEIGQNLTKYISDPPAKMEGTSQQDNYVRRGTDTILCQLDEDIWKARQMKRQQKALHKQVAAQNSGNSVLRPGVETFGDGVRKDERPPGGFKAHSASPQQSGHPSHTTAMFGKEE